MGQNEIKFTLVDTKKVCVSGFPELEGREGCCLGEKNGEIMSRL